MPLLLQCFKSVYHHQAIQFKILYKIEQAKIIVQALATANGYLQVIGQRLINGFYVLK